MILRRIIPKKKIDRLPYKPKINPYFRKKLNKNDTVYKNKK